MGKKNEHTGEPGVVAEAVKPKLVPSPKYKVVILNDDYTPMDFVVVVLHEIFALNYDSAMQLMMKVHTEGRAVCGEFTYDIAETKVAHVNEFAKMHDHPLLCKMEKV